MVHAEGSNLGFREYMKQDRGVWLNIWEFARPFTVDGVKILGVMTSARRSKVENLSGEEKIFFVSCEDVSGVTAGQSVEIDGKIFVVRDAQNLQGVLWKINLSGDVG